MGAPRRVRGRLGLLLLALLAPAAAAEPLPPGRLLPLAVHAGHCACVLPTAGADDKFYLILGSLARAAGPYRVAVRTEPTTDPVSVPPPAPVPDDGWARRTHDEHARLARARQGQPAGDDYPATGDPPPRRLFYLFAGENNFQDAAGYVTITGELRAAGRHCQVYVDRDERDSQGLRQTAADVVRTFDDEIYPRARQAFGRAVDVDRDGRFTVLLTGWLGKLANGKVALGGFVHGSDFYRDVAGPYGNRCDMMYLNADLRPGPYLHTLLAHEYTHAVVFSEHVFGGCLTGVTRPDEEGWLNEGLAHLAEDLHGYSWANLDYRVSAFLSDPERYQLVVPDYYRAGLWRSHGNRGATYLFLRWCADGFGPGLPAELTQSSLNGTANVETAAQQRFEELFRQWSAALALAGTRLPAGAVPPLRRLDLHGPLAGRLLCGPRYRPVPLAGGHEEIRLAGTGAAYLLLHSPAGCRSRLVIDAGPDADLQVSLLQVPSPAARLSLRHEVLEGPKPSVRLALTCHDAAVTLEGAAWERLVPAANRPEDTSYRPEAAADQGSRDWFGDPHLKAGETRSSAAIPLPAARERGDGIVFKVAATDAAGHRVAAWDVLTLEGSGGTDQAETNDGITAGKPQHAVRLRTPDP